MVVSFIMPMLTRESEMGRDSPPNLGAENATQPAYSAFMGALGPLVPGTPATIPLPQSPFASLPINQIATRRD